ncbi:MAG: penicillin acylase family protein, partial [Rhodospirillales bacterium]
MLRRLIRLVFRLAVGVVVGAAIFVAGTILYMRSSVPSYDGSRVVKGLTGPVQIVRDANAIPHIFAKNLEDAYFGLGFVHAQDRLWQMEVMRRVGAGRVSEILPADLIGTPFLDLDKTMRVLAIYRHAEESVGALSPQARGIVESYAKGVNAWIDTHKGALPPEFVVLQHTPEPWRPADSLVWGKLMALTLDGNWRGELLRARLLKAIGPEKLNDLFPQYPSDGPQTLSVVQQALRDLPLDKIYDVTESRFTRKIMASNEWVVGGARSDSGKPLLANDPHLGFEAPGLWYLARLVGPAFDLRGATAPGSPAVVLGTNGFIAWGFTTTNLDSQDLFIEKLDPTNPGRYLTPDGVQPFGVRDETVKIRGANPVTLRIRDTRHGVVISDLADPQATAADSGQVLALQATATDSGDTTAQAIIEVGQARNWREFQTALRKYRGPMQNMVYADVDGNIGFIAPGSVPVRRGGNGWLPSPGWTGEFDWTGYAPFESLPRGFNPPDSRFVNANARIVPPEFPLFITRDWAEPYRQLRADQLLQVTPKHDMQTMAAIQADALTPEARDMLPLLLKATAKHALAPLALDRLRLWDMRMQRDRPEPLIYAAWLRALHRALYADELGEDLFRATRSDTVSRLLQILTRSPSWCDNVKTPEVETCEQTMGAALDNALTELSAAYGKKIANWRWGEAHVALFRHRLFGDLPLIGSWANGQIAVDGWFHTLNRAGGVPGAVRPYAAVHGATFRAIYSADDFERSQFSIPMGQSGNPFSPYYRNMLENWRDFRFVTL